MTAKELGRNISKIFFCWYKKKNKTNKPSSVVEKLQSPLVIASPCKKEYPPTCLCSLYHKLWQVLGYWCAPEWGHNARQRQEKQQILIGRMERSACLASQQLSTCSITAKRYLLANRVIQGLLSRVTEWQDSTHSQDFWMGNHLMWILIPFFRENQLFDSSRFLLDAWSMPHTAHPLGAREEACFLEQHQWSHVTGRLSIIVYAAKEGISAPLVTSHPDLVGTLRHTLFFSFKLTFCCLKYWSGNEPVAV